MAALFVLLLIACGYDYRCRRIPNKLLAVMLIICLGRSLWYAGFVSMARSLMGMAAVVLVLYPLFKIGTLGAGDVKLFGVCVGFLPTDKIFLFVFFSMLIAAIFSIIRFIKDHNGRERLQYLWQYLADVAQSGKWRLYIENETERRAAGICLAGPILCSMLLCWGGAY